MNDETIKQRIKYMVEHGGIYEDPIRALQRQVRVLYVMVGLTLVAHAIEAAVFLT